MIVVAGVALGIVEGKRAFEPDWGDLGWRYGLPQFVGFLLMLASCLMLIFRLRKPRPPIRRVADQPGFVACLAMAAFQFALLAGQFVEDACDGRLENWTDLDWSRDLAFLLGKNYLISCSVVVGWGLLVLGRRWRAEPGWIDGIGRALGFAWIAWGLLGFVLLQVDRHFPDPATLPTYVPFIQSPSPE